MGLFVLLAQSRNLSFLTVIVWPDRVNIDYSRYNVPFPFQSPVGLGLYSSLNINQRCLLSRRLCVDHDAVRPDIVTLGKALAGGLYPVSSAEANSSVNFNFCTSNIVHLAIVCLFCGWHFRRTPKNPYSWGLPVGLLCNSWFNSDEEMEKFPICWKNIAVGLARINESIFV